ncbi:sensor histidine kinase [Bacteroidota bacterium]
MKGFNIGSPELGEFSKKKKRNLFWKFQIFGWISYSTILTLFVVGPPVESLLHLMLRILTFALGFIVSLLLWPVHKWIRHKKIPLYLLTFYVLISTFIFAFLWYVLDNILSYPFMIGDTYRKLAPLFSPFVWVLKTTIWYTIMLLPWSLCYFLINFWIDWNEQKRMTEKNKELFNETRLIMLRYQLNPHFFFNSLNSISALIDENKELAKEMIYKLSDFLRYTFLSDNNLMMNLDDELKIIEKYFDLEKIRFEEKIKIIYDIDPDTLKFKIPGFLLHPIVENAIKYGMKTSPLPLIIAITSKMKKEGLLLEISNTGKWTGNNTNIHEIISQKGIGLKNVYSRLEKTFGSGFNFSILTDNNIVQISLDIPKKNINNER